MTRYKSKVVDFIEHATDDEIVSLFYQMSQDKKCKKIFDKLKRKIIS